MAYAGVDIAPPSTRGSSAQDSSNAGFSFDAKSPTETSIDCKRPVAAASTPSANGKNATGMNATKPTTLCEKKAKRMATTTFSKATIDVM